MRTLSSAALLCALLAARAAGVSMAPGTSRVDLRGAVPIVAVPALAPQAAADAGVAEAGAGAGAGEHAPGHVDTLERIPGRSPSEAARDADAETAGEQGAGGDLFDHAARRESLEAEQVLPERVPHGSDPIHQLGKLFKPFGTTGRIPVEYTPSAARTFGVPTVLIKENNADVITAGSMVEAYFQPILYHDVNGQTFVRKFLHPLEAESARREHPDAPADPEQWTGTPTSSTRSLLIRTRPRGGLAFIAKTSLNYVLAGVGRLVGRQQARLAVQVSAFYDELQAETGGRIPNTDKTWTHFREPAAVGVKGEEYGHTIMRTLPADYAETIYLPFYALLGERDGGGRWIDELYAASGYTDKLEFVWNEIAKPLIELHLLVHLEHGLVTELHQQNALLRVDPLTKRILGFGVRDMDGHSIDYAARRHVLGLSVPPGGLTPETSRTYGYHFARQMPMLGYEYFKDSIFKNLMQFFLAPADVRRLVGLGNEMMLRRFNEKYAPQIGETSRFLDLTQAFQKVYEKKLPREDREFFRQEELSYMLSVPPLVRLFKRAIFGYYRLKQRLERSELPLRSAFADRKGVEPLLERIAEEGRGVVPQEALDYWLFMQRARPASFDAEVPVDPSTRRLLERLGAPVSDTISARRLRALVLGYAQAREDELRRSGATRKATADFADETEVLARLHDFASPRWYVVGGSSVDEFIRLLALPLHPSGIADEVMRVDGYEMPPVEFLRHDELHSLSASAGLQDLLGRRGIVPGSAAYYEYVLERVRLTKRFLALRDALPDAQQRRRVEELWFVAFHEAFDKRWPIHRYHQNFAVSEGNLRRFLSRYRLRLPFLSEGRARAYRALRELAP